MKHWQETSLLLEEAARQSATGHQVALATVVRIAGSAYRRPGAKLLIADGGSMTGGVSGGCLEADVREIALGVIKSGQPALRTYDTSGDEQQIWGLGLGCNGMVEIFIQRLDLDAPWVARLRDALRLDQIIALSTVLTGPDAGATRLLDAAGRLTSGIVDEAAQRAFIEVLEPPPRLVVCGAGDDARPLAALANDAGFRVAVVDHRPAYLAADRFPPGVSLHDARPESGLSALSLTADSCVTILTHSEAHDRGWLRAAFDSPASYIGLLGPRRRGERLLAQLGMSDSPRLFSPIGLDVAADGPEQIAVSVVAELLAVRAARAPRHLRERESGIHAS
ncbi:MAG TPA: XdhC family protein [Gemmatimonadales bacterium]